MRNMDFPLFARKETTFCLGASLLKEISNADHRVPKGIVGMSLASTRSLRLRHCEMFLERSWCDHLRSLYLTWPTPLIAPSPCQTPLGKLQMVCQRHRQRPLSV